MSAPFPRRVSPETTLPLARADLSEQHALEVCRAHGWVFCATTSTLRPKPPPPARAASAFEGFEQLRYLTNIVTQLTT